MSAAFGALLVLAQAGSCGPLATADLADDQPVSAAQASEQKTAQEDASQLPEFERMAQRIQSSSSELLSRSLSARMRLALENPALQGRERFRLEMALAQRLLREGDVAESVAMYEQLLAAERPGAQRRHTVSRALAVAYMRLAEVENCVARHNADCCVFPLAGGGVHSVAEPARKALEGFLSFLEFKPQHLPTRWLANIAAMALGEWPEALPSEQRLPESAFASEHELARFRDRAPELGVDRLNLCGGVAVEDFDGDGRLDILTSTYDPLGSLALYRNRGDGTFTDASVASRASDQLGGLNLVAADYDGDGDRDVLLLRGAWLTVDGRLRNSLLRNDGGTFVDVTRSAGLADPARPTQAAAFGDFDNDGDLDLFVANESMGVADSNQNFPSQLFRNNGDGTFTDVAAKAGVTNDRYGKAVTVGDYDDDGDLDLYVSNFGPNRLYRNDGELRFTDVALELGVSEPDGRSFACWFFDFDGDARLDLFVTSYAGSTADIVSEMLGQSRERPRPRLYRNTGDGFEEVGRAVGLDRFFLPMGANFGDVDGDGWLDLYLTTGDPSLESIMPNVLLRNQEGERFQDVTTASGLGHLQKGHGVSFCDLDDDGDQDIYHQLGGFYPGDRFHNALFENPGTPFSFLTLDLVGTVSNRDGIGARVTVKVQTGEGSRSLHRAVGSVSSFGGSPHRLEIGLGNAERILSIEVSWPGTAEPQRFEEVPLNAFLRIVEGQEAFERIERDPIALDGKAPR